MVAHISRAIIISQTISNYFFTENYMFYCNKMTYDLFIRDPFN